MVMEPVVLKWQRLQVELNGFASGNATEQFLGVLRCLRVLQICYYLAVLVILPHPTLL